MGPQGAHIRHGAFGMITIHVIRKPLSEGNVASNVQRWETGALNIDASRVATTDPTVRIPLGGFSDSTCYGDSKTLVSYESNLDGRWPANLILQAGAPVEDLDEQSGESRSAPISIKAGAVRFTGNCMAGGKRGFHTEDLTLGFTDSGGASRFFKQVPDEG